MSTQFATKTIAEQLLMTEMVAQQYPCQTDSEQAPALVLLHGWGMDSQVWQEFVPSLTRYFNLLVIDLPGYGANLSVSGVEWIALDIDKLVGAILPLLPTRAILLGWSMGGMVATALASQYPERITALITLCSNPCFVQKADWPHAVAADLYLKFQNGISTNLQKTRQQFVNLQCLHCDNERELAKNLRAQAVVFSEAVLTNGLALMAALDLRPLLKTLNAMPVLHLFGERDVLIPIGIVADITELNSQHRVAVIEGASHLPFISHLAAVTETVIDFLRDSHLMLNGVAKRDIANSFSRSAKSYDAAASFQALVAEKLLEKLPAKQPAAVVVDLGCGTGRVTAQLGQHWPALEVYGLDIAIGMLTHGASCHPLVSGWVSGDAEALPLKSASVDLLFSNFALQWCQGTDAFMREAARVLTPQGYFLFSTLGPHTFWELKEAWRNVDSYTHVNPFRQRSAIVASALKAGFKIVELSEWEHSVEYSQLKEFTQELKALGAHNMTAGRAKGLTGKSRYKRFVTGYERFRKANGRLPATYQVYFVVLQLDQHE